MGLRTDLQTLLEAFLTTGKVYFQAPLTVKMEYPCIVYERRAARTDFADNEPYHLENQYQVTLIDPNPDSDIWAKIASLPKCLYETHYNVDGLNHDVFNLYY